MDRWIVSKTKVSKNHSNIGIVYRDTTQADYEFSDVHNSSRRSSGASTQLDTGESFFVDETKKTLCDPDDVFFDLAPAAVRTVSDPRTISGGPKDKTLLLLDKPIISHALSHSSMPSSHDMSPTTAVLELWERNETFQDLTQLIEEERSSSSSTPCFPPDSMTDKGPVGSLRDSPGWMAGHPSTSKRPFDPCEAGSSTSAPAAKACCLDRGVHPPRADQYTKMRVRNNEASKRSRMTRREKEQELEQKALELEQENQVLTIQVKNLEEVIETLKKRLINAIIKK